MAPTTLTAHLTSLPSLQTLLQGAISHPFLRRAGDGTLPESTLNAWFVQDIHYQRGYVRFMGALLAQLRLPIHPDSKGVPDSGGPNSGDGHGGEPGDVLYRVLDLLISALTAIHTEISFYESTLHKYSLRLDRSAPVDDVTRAYVDLFDSFANGGQSSLLEGVVVLWATEMCYHKAWAYAASVAEAEGGGREGNAARALHEALIPNWTSEGFAAFVKQCEDVANELAEYEGVRIPKEGEGKGHLLERCEETFRHVLWLEERFWPE